MFSFYFFCRTNKYNKLVLAQHLDDLVESFLMSALHNGQVRVFDFVRFVKLTVCYLSKFRFVDNFNSQKCFAEWINDFISTGTYDESELQNRGRRRAGNSAADLRA